MFIVRWMQEIDTWLVGRRFRWGALWLSFALMAVASAVLLFNHAGWMSLAPGLIYLVFGLRYIRPNISLPFL
jgi:hypothetical protein